jgi:hypothetical protein
MWCILKGDTATKGRENAPASVIPSPIARTGVSELISIKLQPSLHFESCFSGIQLLVVEEPSPVACVAYYIFGKLPSLHH